MNTSYLLASVILLLLSAVLGRDVVQDFWETGNSAQQPTEEIASNPPKEEKKWDPAVGPELYVDPTPQGNLDRLILA